MSLHHLSRETALGLDPNFPCPLQIPREITESLEVIEIPYWGFDNEEHTGQLVIHAALVIDVRDIFAELLRARFPIESMIPVAAYGWIDAASMAANNTSAWNYRYIADSNPPRLSPHAFGRAVDINPRLNPCISPASGECVPVGARHDPEIPGTITSGALIVQLFCRRGWKWGGEWQDPIDLHHFQKAV